MKTCTSCGEAKPLDEFHAHGRNPDGRAYQCKACVSAYWKARYSSNKVKYRLQTLRNKYGLSLEDVERMYREQNGRCAICNDEAPLGITTDVGGPYKSLGVDHNHTTGVIRGLLCSPCNIAIGKLKEDPMVLDRAAQYLRMYS